MSDEVFVPSQIPEEAPDLKFYKLVDGVEVVPRTVKFNTSGQVEEVTSIEEVTYGRHELEIVSMSLEVPGVGFLRPGTRVRIDDDTFVLNFGDHTNISNQRIISWYLTPDGAQCTPDPLGRAVCIDRTLYTEMIDQIDLITV